jgi:hypothetical protein
METIKLSAEVNDVGQLVLELPKRLANQRVEVWVTVPNEAISSEPMERDANGWPVGFFERTFGALADDPLEIPAQLPLEIRDDIE